MASYDKDELSNERPDEKEAKERRSRIRAQIGAMGKLHNIVIHIRASAGRTTEFVISASRRIPLDNRTRWNGWYNMLKVA
jgi:hypothetical protein